MKLRTLIQLPITLAAVLAATPVYAELFKWVDARGVTNYSNQPPADPEAAKKVTTVEDRISVYTPDKALLDAVAANRQQSAGRTSVAGKIERLEQQLEDERRARQYAAADAQAARDALFYTSRPYVAAPIFVPVRSRPLRSIGQAQLAPGTIVGNVVGMNGFTAGNSAGAPPGFLLPSLPGRSTSAGRGSAGR